MSNELDKLIAELRKECEVSMYAHSKLVGADDLTRALDALEAMRKHLHELVPFVTSSNEVIPAIEAEITKLLRGDT